MITDQRVRTVRAPWHLWVCALAVLGIYLAGARDYLLVLGDDTDYILSKFGAQGLAYFTDYPLGLRIIWTVNVAAGLIAALLLLARSRHVVPVAVVAAGSQVLLSALTFAYRDRWDALGVPTSLWDIGISVVTVLFAGYCLRIRSRLAVR